MNIFEIVAREQANKNQNAIQLNFFFYQIKLKEGIIVPVFIDENVENVIGYQPDELISRSLDELKIIDEYYREEIHSYYTTAKENPGHYDFQTVLIHKEGHPVFIRNKGVSTLGQGGKVDNFIGYVESLSYIDFQHLQPETTSKIIKIAHDCGSVGTFYYDIRLNKLHWSDEVKKIHGYETEPTIEEFGTLIQAKEKFSTDNVIKKVLESKNGYQSIYSYYRKKDNTKLYILAIMFPIIDDKKNLIAISGNVINLLDPTDTLEIWNRPSSRSISSKNDAVFIKQHNQYVKVPIKDIVAISSMRDYIQIYTKNRIPPYIHYTTLYKFKESLPEDLFFQIHRSHIINLSMINKVSSNQIVVNDLTFPVSRNYRPKLMEVIHR